MRAMAGFDDAKVEQGVRLILEGIGEDPDRGGLKDTPARVARMFREIAGGVGEDPTGIVTVVEGADFDEWFFLHDLPDDVRREADEGPEFDQSDRPFADPWPLEAWPDVPTRVIATAEDRFFPLAFQQRVARERLGVEPVVVPGGHLAALSRPVELADALLAPY